MLPFVVYASELQEKSSCDCPYKGEFFGELKEIQGLSINKNLSGLSDMEMKMLPCSLIVTVPLDLPH